LRSKPPISGNAPGKYNTASDKLYILERLLSFRQYIPQTAAKFGIK